MGRGSVSTRGMRQRQGRCAASLGGRQTGKVVASSATCVSPPLHLRRPPGAVGPCRSGTWATDFEADMVALTIQSAWACTHASGGVVHY
eukprot:364416-Chlamydomonas_euryale.AAC.1